MAHQVYFPPEAINAAEAAVRANYEKLLASANTPKRRAFYAFMANMAPAITRWSLERSGDTDIAVFREAMVQGLACLVCTVVANVSPTPEAEGVLVLNEAAMLVPAMMPHGEMKGQLTGQEMGNA